jgi:hypothetical protein
MRLKWVLSVVTMCVLTVIHTSEVLVRYGDGMVYVATELACGCVRLRPASLSDLERGLAFVDGEDADTEGTLGNVVSPWEDGPDEPAVLSFAA